MMTEQIRPGSRINNGNVEPIGGTCPSVTMTYPYFPVSNESAHFVYKVVEDFRRNGDINFSPVNGVFCTFIPNSQAILRRAICIISCSIPDYYGAAYCS